MFTMITGTVEGTFIFNEILNDDVVKVKSKRFRPRWLDLLGSANTQNFCARWRGPEKDPVDILEQTKVWLIKESGYF